MCQCCRERSKKTEDREERRGALQQFLRRKQGWECLKETGPKRHYLRAHIITNQGSTGNLTPVLTSRNLVLTSLGFSGQFQWDHLHIVPFVLPELILFCFFVRDFLVSLLKIFPFKIYSVEFLCLSFCEEGTTLRGKVAELEKEMPLISCNFLLKKYHLRGLLKCAEQKEC